MLHGAGQRFDEACGFFAELRLAVKKLAERARGDVFEEKEGLAVVFPIS